MRNASFLLPAALLFGFLTAFMVVSPAFGQAGKGSPANRQITNEFIHSQFGKEFTLVPGVDPVFGDLDGDGIEDVAIAARCKNPMLDQGNNNFLVVDPYYDFFGYGDPRVTTTFTEADPALRGLVVLIIHGAGAESWRAPQPKAKYVIVNLPYKTLSVRKMRLRKKTIQAVFVEEAGDFGDTSALFYDGRKFRYTPMGGDMQ